jgi:hypothetical protein
MKKHYLIVVLVFLIIIGNLAQACSYNDWQGKSKEINCSETNNDEYEYMIDIEELSNFVTKLSYILDKLIERFPIIEEIIQKILLWLYLQFVV